MYVDFLPLFGCTVAVTNGLFDNDVDEHAVVAFCPPRPSSSSRSYATALFILVEGYHRAVFVGIRNDHISQLFKVVTSVCIIK